MTINLKLTDEVINFCKINDITDFDKFVLETFESGFNVERYGSGPFFKGEKPKPEIIEKIIEREVIKEVPVEKIVEKEIYITDEKKYIELAEELSKLQTLYNDNLKVTNDYIKQLELAEKEIDSFKVKLEENKTVKRDRDIYGEYM